MKPGLTLTIGSLLTANASRQARYFTTGESVWNDTAWVVAIGGEVGEALNVVKKILRHRQQVAGNSSAETPEALLAKLGEELADVAIYCVVVTGLKRRELPWDDFRSLRRYVRSIRDNQQASSLASLACELLWWAGAMAVTDGTREVLTSRQLEGLIAATANLADVAGIDLGAAVVAKFNATSEKLGFPERL